MRIDWNIIKGSIITTIFIVGYILMFISDFRMLTSSIEGLPWTENSGFEMIAYPILVFLQSLFLCAFGAYFINMENPIFIFPFLPFLGMNIGLVLGIVHQKIDPTLMDYQAYYYVEIVGLLGLVISLFLFFRYLKYYFLFEDSKVEKWSDL